MQLKTGSRDKVPLEHLVPCTPRMLRSCRTEPLTQLMSHAHPSIPLTLACCTRVSDTGSHLHRSVSRLTTPTSCPTHHQPVVDRVHISHTDHGGTPACDEAWACISYHRKQFQRCQYAYVPLLGWLVVGGMIIQFNCPFYV